MAEVMNLVAVPEQGAKYEVSCKGDRLACAIGCPEVVPPADHAVAATNNDTSTHFSDQYGYGES